MNRCLRFAGFCLIAFFVFTGVGCLKYPGIEIGNPKPEEQPTEGQPIRIVPEDMDETYEIIPLDGQIALVRQLSSIEPAHILDTVTIPYHFNENVLVIEARFINGRLIVVTASLPEEGNIDGTLTVNGAPVEACFEIPGQTPSCPHFQIMEKSDFTVKEVEPSPYDNLGADDAAPSHHGKGIADIEETINPHTVQPATKYQMMFDDSQSGDNCDENDRLCKKPPPHFDLSGTENEPEEDSRRSRSGDSPFPHLETED